MNQCHWSHFKVISWKEVSWETRPGSHSRQAATTINSIGGSWVYRLSGIGDNRNTEIASES